MPASTTECSSGSGGGGGGASGASGGDRYVRVAGPHVTVFLRTALLMVHICMQPPSSSSLDPEEASGTAGGSDGLEEKVANNGSGRLGLLPSADDAFSPLCRFFGFPTSAEALLAEPGLLDAARRWLACVSGSETVLGPGALPADGGPVVGNTVGSLLLRLRRENVCRRLFDFPSPVKIDLVRLPHAYTELHAQVSSSSSSSSSSSFSNNDNNDNSNSSSNNSNSGGSGAGHPAVCLVCGEVLDASGRGECTRHAAECGCGTGLFFLLQECAVLLIHGRRAAYFPSPYVDAYGERQRHSFRGRPLYLDQRRYDVVRGLWVKHLVAHEVVQNRSTSRQVIINDHY
ncbi:unnamed protein product [Ectocarpus sp. CCAP 1310/34]|nr:unnamed protein product [Ectocarpus sp. CCAP 1310/34]